MRRLTDQEKQLILDYCIGLTSQTEAAEAEKLIASEGQAAEIHAKIKQSLSPLEILRAEVCPDELAEGTVWRLKNAARSAELKLQQLLAEEQARGVSTMSRLWHNLGSVFATAAAIVLIAGVMVPAMRRARYNYWQQACQMRLAGIGTGINLYREDHDDNLPAVAAAKGEPWWKVGYQGSENHSNTRSAWLLVKQGYVQPINFVCPGYNRGALIQFDGIEVKDFNDFPSRQHINYSLRIRCGKAAGSDGAAKALMADLNPLFENLPANYSKPLHLKINIELLSRNSINHNRRGQNVLFSDGSTRFVKNRLVGTEQDDIFTLRGTELYEGNEVPSCETDAFLAP
jgi:hypothetical protein